jgi:amino acid adenylation domain-containing protein
VETLAQLGCKVLLEVGPQPVLVATAMRAWPEGRETPRAVASMRKDVGDSRQVVEALGQLYASGSRPDFRAFDRPWPRKKLDLPTYPFQRRRFWFEASAPAEADGTSVAARRTPAPASGPPVAAGATPAEATPAGEPDAWLADIDPAEREARLAGFIRTELGRALRVAPEEISVDAPFATLGMDSLTAMELRSRAQAALGTFIPPTLLFTHPTASALARGLLERWLATRADPAQRCPPIPRTPREGALALSHAQEQLWFLHELVPSSSAYNVAVQVHIRGPLDAALLGRSFEAIVARHEVLRTTFRSEGGVPQAVVAPARAFELPVHDVSDEAEVGAWALREANATFDIATGPLLRARLLRRGPADHVLLLAMHHIVTDAWSFGVLLSELGQVYQALRRDQPSPLPELPIQYADYAAWQRQWLQGEALDEQLAYWKHDLAGAPPLDLATDRPRPRTSSFRGARLRFELGEARAKALRALCAEENVTLFVPLLAAFAAVLQRYSGQDDFVIGTLTANRTRLELENLIGFFVNALPVRMDLAGDPDVRTLLQRLRQRMLDVMTHQDVPFDLIVNAAERGREGTRNPLFQVQIVLQPAARTQELAGLAVDVSEVDTQTAKRDLTLTLFDDETLAAHVEYATDLFDAGRIERLVRHLEILLDAMIEDRGRRLSALPLLTESEQALQRKRPGARRTGARSVQEMLDEAVARTPDAIAVTAADGTLTYGQLDQAANRVAHGLMGRGVTRGTPVALRAGRSLEMPIGLLAILKAGGVYVPVDPNYPADRTAYMMADGGVRVTLDGLQDPELARASAGPVPALSEPDDLAYIIYTSGSTGRPKGVKVSHGSVVEYAETLGRELGIVAGDVYLHTASLSFSSAMRQMLVPLAAGATVAIADADERRDPLALLRRMRDSRVTVADLVPTVVRQIVDALEALAPAERRERLAPGLRLLLTASEPLRFGLVREWRALFGAGPAWINMYGQTETTGIVSLYPVPEVRGDDQRIVPIGRPRPNVTMRVLDRQGRPQPCGIAGELYIGGEALASGYTGDPALTAERFRENHGGDGERLYASGDVVRMDDDGTIEFLGRSDQQVKVRGLRVEPAEVERVLLEHPAVREAVVVAWDDGREDARLAAYYTTKSAPVLASTLRAHARQKLPDHLVPSAFVALARLPLTPTGKIDRAALPRPEGRRDEEVAYVPPRPGLEESLAAIWRQVLRVDRAGASDNFFALGGHSLLAAQVRARIQGTLGVEIPLAALFEDQTLAALALRIEAGVRAGERAERTPLRRVARTERMPASYAQELMWQAERAEPGSAAHWIDVGLLIRGPLDAALLRRCVQAAVERHELLRTVFAPVNGSVAQVILPSHAPDVRLVEATESAPPLAAEPLDLTERPAFRAELRRTGPDAHVLRLNMHRILADGFSVRLLLGEVASLYAASGGVSPLPLLETQVQYADFAAWERAWLTPERLRGETAYFTEQLRGAESFRLPTDRPRPPQRTRQGLRLPFELSPVAARAARALATRERASLYMVLLAAFASALARYARRPDVVVGSPVSRRSQPGTEQILGPFMNTLPLHIVANGAGLPALVGQVKERLLGALAHQDAPLQCIVSELGLGGDAGAAGLGEVALVMDEPAPGELRLGDLSLARLPAEAVVARRELTLSVAAGEDEIAGTVVYDRDLFDPATIEGITRDFEGKLATAVGD